MAGRLEGTVKWFNDTKGYGFIQAAGKDYFVHQSDIRMNGHRTLQDGAQVEFTPDRSDKGNGFKATEVDPL